MLPERPRSETRPCPACGNLVDPLRAPRVLWLEDGVRFLCGEACREGFLAGQCDYDDTSRSAAPAPDRPRPSIPDLVRGATLVSAAEDANGAERVSVRRYDPIVAAGLATLALGIVAMSPSPELGWLSAFFIALCAAVNARIPLTTLAAGSSLSRIAPMGLALAAVSSLLGVDPSAQRSSLVGAALAGIALSSRRWIHKVAWAPVRALGRDLRRQLPVRARVPSDGESAYEELASTAVLYAPAP